MHVFILNFASNSETKEKLYNYAKLIWY